MKNSIINKIISGIVLATTCFSLTCTSNIVSAATNFYAPDEPTYGNYFNSDYDTR